MFLDDETLSRGSWQSLERAVCRLLVCEGFEGVRQVSSPGDKGADIIAHINGRRFLYQVKRWQRKIGLSVIDETLKAQKYYGAHVPVIVSLNGFEENVRLHQQQLLARQIPLQLIDRIQLGVRAGRLPERRLPLPIPRPYQEPMIDNIVRRFDRERDRALIVLATGLGKTFLVAESLRRINSRLPIKVLVLAHTNELVYQLEKAFWNFLDRDCSTVVWNGFEKPGEQSLESANFTFACHRSVADFIDKKGELPLYDVIVVDECHHAGGAMYKTILTNQRAGSGDSAPFLLGLTATPWRSDNEDVFQFFGRPLATMDIVTGLRNGFLANIDYRIHTDNINWKALAELKGSAFSPRYINRTLFITEWDDAVVRELRDAWKQVSSPRAIVFCGTIDHAITMRDRINALGFCRAEALYSRVSGGSLLSGAERNRLLCDFQDGLVQVMCSVDILNEGIDVPDVNILVFQRVTHSRRIFVQQLGRGLRLSPSKEKVLVLDFVSDIRRFAAGLELQKALNQSGARDHHYVTINHRVSFRRLGIEDPRSESFLRQWLEDVAEIEEADEDSAVLKFPPPLE